MFIIISEVEVLGIKELEEWKKKCTKKIYNDCIHKLSNHKNLSKYKLVNLILISCLFNPKEAIYEARKKNVFNFSKVANKEKIVFIIEHLLKNDSIIHYEESEKKYLLEKRELNWLFDYYKKTETSLINKIIELEKNRVYYKENKSVVYSTTCTDLLSILDGLFMGLFNINFNKETDIFNKKGFNTYKSLIDDYAIEEISEGVSYLYKLYNKNLKNLYNVSEVIIVNKKNILNNGKVLKELIEKAVKIQTIKEWEATIDFLGYKVEKQENIYTIRDIDSGFEKSMSLGYIRFAEQRFIFEKRASDGINESDITLDKIADSIYSKDLFQKVGKGKRERIMFIINQPIINIISKTMGSDEKNELEYFSKEWSLTQEEIEQKKIAENLYFIDLLKFIKPFRLIQKLIVKYIAETPGIRATDIMGLGQFWMDEQMFFKLVKEFLEKDKIKIIKELLTANLNSEHLDLQYTPFVIMGGKIGVFLSLISANNILRNFVRQSFQSKNLFVTNNNGLDGLSMITSSVFIENGNFEVFENVKYRYAGNEHEIDVIAIGEENIYLMECKNALFPTDMYELRTSIDHLKKAQKQLETHKEIFENEEWIQAFLSKKGISKRKRKIYTLIIMGNRIFNGCTQFGHPIRTVFELDMILNKGSITTPFANFRVWENEEFGENDLLNYLNENISFIRKQYDSLEKFEKEILINGKKLKYETYALNQLELMKKLKSSYSVEIINRELYERLFDMNQNDL